MRALCSPISSGLLLALWYWQCVRSASSVLHLPTWDYNIAHYYLLIFCSLMIFADVLRDSSLTWHWSHLLFARYVYVLEKFARDLCIFCLFSAPIAHKLCLCWMKYHARTLLLSKTAYPGEFCSCRPSRLTYLHLSLFIMFSFFLNFPWNYPVLFWWFPLQTLS